MTHSNTMPHTDLFLGIDYHQHRLQVCILDPDGRVVVNRPLDNHWQAVVDLAGQHGRIRRAAIEACPGAADLAEQLVELAGWHVELAHPAYVAKLKRSPDKSDFSDARLLADLTRVGYLPRAWLPGRWTRQLRQLVRYRQQQVEAGRHAKLRIGALLREHRLRPADQVRRWTKAWLAWLEHDVKEQLPAAAAWVLERQVAQIAHAADEVRAAEAQLHEHTEQDVTTARLLDQPGIGPVTAWVLRAEVDRFDRFDSGKALARFCGLSPRNASSGERDAQAGLVDGCSRLLRATLVELGHRLIRTQPRWTKLAGRWRGAGKAGSVVAAAVANRYVRQLYYRMIEPGSPPSTSTAEDAAPHGQEEALAVLPR